MCARHDAVTRSKGVDYAYVGYSTSCSEEGERRFCSARWFCSNFIVSPKYNARHND